MKRIWIFSALAIVGWTLTAQTRLEKEITVVDESFLDIHLDFASEVVMKPWNSNKVKIEALVSINDGANDDMFQIDIQSSSRTISIEMDRELWEEGIDREKRNCWNSDISVTVFFPSSLELKVETISASYELDYYGKPIFLKTISGDIDLSIEKSQALDIQMKTISGEVFSDLDLLFPEGKSGLRQLVGTNILARLGAGGELNEIETISGNIFLRRK